MNSDEAQRHRHSLNQAIQNAAHSAPPGPLKDAVLAISEVLDALLAEIQKSCSTVRYLRRSSFVLRDQSACIPVGRKPSEVLQILGSHGAGFVRKRNLWSR
jgi:hypothetical protein